MIVKRNQLSGFFVDRSGSFGKALAPGMEFAIIPKSLLNRFISDPDSRLHLNIFLSSLLLLLAFSFLPVLEIAGAIPHVCVFQFLFHLPCPGCHVVRGLNLMVESGFMTAWKYSPAAVMVGSFLLLQIPLRLCAFVWARPRVFLATSSKWIGRSVLASLAVAWLVNIFG